MNLYITVIDVASMTPFMCMLRGNAQLTYGGDCQFSVTATLWWSFCWTSSSNWSALYGKGVKDCLILSVIWTACSFLTLPSQSSSTPTTLLALRIGMSLLVCAALTAGPALHSIEDLHRLIKHPENRPADIKRPQSSEKGMTSTLLAEGFYFFQILRYL